MRLGATLAQLAPGPPLDVVDRARALVAAGFESLWVPQVLGRGLATPDPFVALAAVATACPQVDLGTATLQLPLHHPADLAHRVLTLKAVCGDRLSLGVSPGSTATDFATLDREFATRFRVFDSTLERLRVLLETGRDAAADLTPARTGAPPLLLGSWGAKVERAAREFDGWLASAYRTTPDEILAAHDRYRAAGGRRAVVCHIPVTSPRDVAALGRALRGYADAGFDEAVVLIEPGGPPPEQVRALLP
jgi:alkanesulfonate monooxygenase SsuD/methylene tetrahydromethanopterin reductase-like flavin-dependent oxidoreductase (luciferase family)